MSRPLETADQVDSPESIFQEGLSELIGDSPWGLRHSKAMMVVWASMLVGPVPSKIAALTGIDESTVVIFGANLYDSGIWLREAKIGLEYPDDPEHQLIELTLHGLVAEGIVVKVRDPREKGLCMDCKKPTGRRSDKLCTICQYERFAVLSA